MRRDAKEFRLMCNLASPPRKSARSVSTLSTSAISHDRQRLVVAQVKVKAQVLEAMAQVLEVKAQVLGVKAKVLEVKAQVLGVLCRVAAKA